MMVEEIDIREKLASAAQTGDLTPEGGAATMIGALGAATMMPCKATRDVTVPSKVNRRTELGARLERAKYAGDAQALHSAALLLAVQLGSWRRECDRLRVKRRDPRMLVMARILVWEWVNDRCDRCGGIGWQMQRENRTDKPVTCATCDGGGWRRTDHAARAVLLGLTMVQYEAGWLVWMGRAREWLKDAETNVIDRLHRQNRRGIVRPVNGL